MLCQRSKAVWVVMYVVQHMMYMGAEQVGSSAGMMNVRMMEIVVYTGVV